MINPDEVFLFLMRFAVFCIFQTNCYVYCRLLFLLSQNVACNLFASTLSSALRIVAGIPQLTSIGRSI